MVVMCAGCANDNEEPFFIDQGREISRPYIVSNRTIGPRIQRVYLGRARCIYQGFDGKYVVYWTASRSNHDKVYALNVETLKETLVTTEPGIYFSQGISEGKVLVSREMIVNESFEHRRAYYVYDLETQTREWLFNSDMYTVIEGMSIAGDWISYYTDRFRSGRSSEDKKNEWDLILYNYKTKEKRKVVRINLARLILELFPASGGLSENVMAYMDNDQEHFKKDAPIHGVYVTNRHIYYSHMSTYIGYYLKDQQKVERIPVHGVIWPMVSENYILFQKIQKSVEELDVYDTKTKELIQAVVKTNCKKPISEYNVYQGNVAWVDWDSGEVHYFDIRTRQDRILFKANGGDVTWVGLNEKYVIVASEKDQAFVDIYRL